jgi:hypothetical protein
MPTGTEMQARESRDNSRLSDPLPSPTLRGGHEQENLAQGQAYRTAKHPVS